jgi:hypothetical protein
MGLVAYIENHFKLYSALLQKFFRRFYKEQHQLTSTTSYNRYPFLFEELKRNVSGNTIRILSYGCSTGEECFTLKDYFPSAKIIGADINLGNIKKAQKKNNSPDIHFIQSENSELINNGSYDIILCLSVLCRWEDTRDVDNCASIYPFSKYEQTVRFLSSLLVNGGILVIYNSNFPFEQTKEFKNYEVIPSPTVPDSGFVHKFDSTNNRLNILHKNCFYRKLAKDK